jgi:hypothetical protein
MMYCLLRKRGSRGCFTPKKWTSNTNDFSQIQNVYYTKASSFIMANVTSTAVYFQKLFLYSNINVFFHSLLKLPNNKLLSKLYFIVSQSINKNYFNKWKIMARFGQDNSCTMNIATRCFFHKRKSIQTVLFSE